MISDIKRVYPKHKNNKLLYYSKALFRLAFPDYFTSLKKDNILRQLDKHPRSDIINKRVNYYCKDFDKCYLPDNISFQIGDISIRKLGNRGKVYFHDTYEYLRYFDKNLKFIPLFGDITYIPEHPSITKSRPILGNNANSVILKLDKIRHFLFIKDSIPWHNKKNMLVGRSKARQEHRIRFLEKYYNHYLCNVGQINKDCNCQFVRQRMTIDEHLNYKFILCLEGNDVASNLKWVLSSNSLAVSSPLVYETWFMEADLRPNEHYVAIRSDYSDLEERIQYYLDHPKEAVEIIENAHQYVEMFRKDEDEKLCSLLVLDKYFRLTQQI